MFKAGGSTRSSHRLIRHAAFVSESYAYGLFQRLRPKNAALSATLPMSVMQIRAGGKLTRVLGSSAAWRLSRSASPANSGTKKPLEVNPAAFLKWSGRRDSNSRRLPWQGSALPTELRPQNRVQEVGGHLRPSTAIFAVINSEEQWAIAAAPTLAVACPAGGPGGAIRGASRISKECTPALGKGVDRDIID